MNKNIIVKPPQSIAAYKWAFDEKPSLFLAGSIDNGKAINWQARLEADIADRNLLIFNPRRDDWNSDWKQDASNPLFYEQVNWELTALDKTTIIAMYFAPGSVSPITLLELGLYASSHRMIICCPDTFWRKGNVDIVAQKYGIPVHDNYETFLLNIKTKLGIL
jgi:hypothetical protein